LHDKFFGTVELCYEVQHIYHLSSSVITSTSKFYIVLWSEFTVKRFPYDKYYHFNASFMMRQLINTIFKKYSFFSFCCTSVKFKKHMRLISQCHFLRLLQNYRVPSGSDVREKFFICSHENWHSWDLWNPRPFYKWNNFADSFLYSW